MVKGSTNPNIVFLRPKYVITVPTMAHEKAAEKDEDEDQLLRARNLFIII